MHVAERTRETPVQLPIFAVSGDQQEYYTRFLNECVTDHPLVGTRIWRQFQKLAGHIVLKSVRFIPRDENQPTLFRAFEQPYSGRRKRCHAAPNLTHRGTMCYCFSPINDDLWTYFIVEMVHPTENVLVVRPVNSMEELVEEFSGA